MKILRQVPWGLIILRVLGCPLIIFGAELGWTGGQLSAIVIAALLSDVYDGILARRWGGETVQLRMADSIADTIFYLGVVVALWLRKPAVIRDSCWLFVALLVLEVGRYVFDLLKFGKAASYHSYLAKLWGLLVTVSVVGAFSFEKFGIMIRLAVVFGLFVNLEGFGMSLILPRWKNDVRTLRQAWFLRQKMLLAGYDVS